MKRYKIKATALSPIHIGTGEVYEPTNFIIDKEKEKYYLYFFKEENFYKNLPLIDKKKFLELASNTTPEAIFDLWKFIAQRKKIIKDIYSYKVLVSSGVGEYYINKLGKPTQLSEKKDIKIYNQFQIQKAIRNLNTKKLYIPGSSIKGAINTALEEKFKWYHNTNYHKELIISDSIPKVSYEMVGYALNKERFEEDMIGPKTYIETILSTPSAKSIFEFDITIKHFSDLDKHLNIKHILESNNSHYKPLFDSMFEDEEIKKVLGRKFKETYKNLTKSLKSNQFLLRVGKHSGARAVTIEEKRKILVRIAQIQNKRGEKDFDGEKRIKRMYRKSDNESDKLEELMIDFSKLNERERRDMEIFDMFYFEPERLEYLIRRQKRLPINAILKEETTTWLFGYKNKLIQNSQLPFGWLLCEIIEEKEI